MSILRICLLGSLFVFASCSHMADSCCGKKAECSKSCDMKKTDCKKSCDLKE